MKKALVIFFWTGSLIFHFRLFTNPKSRVMLEFSMRLELWASMARFWNCGWNRIFLCGYLLSCHAILRFFQQSLRKPIQRDLRYCTLPKEPSQLYFMGWYSQNWKTHNDGAGVRRSFKACKCRCRSFMGLVDCWVLEALSSNFKATNRQESGFRERFGRFPLEKSGDELNRIYF